MSIIYVDFDKTLTTEHGFDSDPQRNVVAYINSCYDKGDEIVIYSCRSNPDICDPKEESRMILYLRQNGINYTRIAKDKPYWDLLIDDKTLNPKLLDERLYK